jgi:cell division protease FtsH
MFLYLMTGVGLAVVLFLMFLGINPFPLVVLLAMVWLVTSLQGGRISQGSFGAKKAANNKGSSTIPTTRFEEIGGQEHAKTELKEALDFLLHHERMEAYGIRPIKGILLAGPPGTGKTLMAKAAAHYTDSVFISASGSEFVEKYVGVGAQRIRRLFQNARKAAKKNRKKSAIIFIDEIDVIGGKREGGQQREYDQTLNQLLTEMDGIHVDGDVRMLIMAATNRKEMLDPALLRPGRFDRHILVDLPDKQARLQILTLHARNKPLSPDVSLDKVAQDTFGFSGAQLESLTNEAAIYALRQGSEQLEPAHFQAAIDKVMMGEKTDREAAHDEKLRVAMHELGHAIMAELVQPCSVSSVALSPRGQALGYVRQHPGQDRYLYTKEELEGRIRVCLAGAAAEQLVLGSKSTGAQNDYEQANRYARGLVQSGLSERGIIDAELIAKSELHETTTKILNELQTRTEQQLASYLPLFEECTAILMREEVLNGDEFRQLLREKASA